MLYISLTHRTGRNSLKLGNQIRIVKQQICLNVGISRLIDWYWVTCSKYEYVMRFFFCCCQKLGLKP